MTENERLEILSLLSEGKITVEEADRRLRAVGDEAGGERSRGRGAAALAEEVGAEVRRAIRSVQASEIARTVSAEVGRAAGTVQRLDLGRLVSEIVAQVKAAIAEAAGGASDQRAVTDECFSVEAGDARLVQVEDTNGNVEVHGGPGEIVAVTATKRVRAGTQGEAEAFAAEVLVTVIQDGEKIRVGHQHPEPPHGVHVQVDYAVECPARMGAEVSTMNGNLKVAGLAGGVAASASNGNAALEGCSGQLEVKTRNGNVAIKTAELNGDAQLATTNGNVSAEVIAGQGHLTAVTTNGNVSVQLPGGEVPVVARTTNGNVEIRLPAEFCGRVEARTGHGRIHTDFQLASVESEGKGELIGRIGEAGGPELELRTVTGNLRLLRVEEPAP
ncbi:MAG: DUF4097 family beta strand repeat-containing protein [Candidatus Latescibacterota bacterium]|jgi:hypothetical protein